MPVPAPASRDRALAVLLSLPPACYLLWRLHRRLLRVYDPALADVLDAWATLSPSAAAAVATLAESSCDRAAFEVAKAQGLSTGSQRPLGAMVPVANGRAPRSVFRFAHPESGATVAWRNVYSLPVEYDVELCPRLLDPAASDALALRGLPSGGKRRRFVVIDANVHGLYQQQLQRYFAAHAVECHLCVISGEEPEKRWRQVETVLEALCAFGLHRREPIVAVGGGCVLDIVGLAASLYRRGVPFIRVPTTLLAIVDAAVGVKNGVDWVSDAKGPLKNRVGTFYGPAGALCDVSFIATQDARNLVNGLGEVMKLALVRSPELFGILEAHGAALVACKFQSAEPALKAAAARVIELGIEIMLEELGPNLWEYKLERCVDYGHTFSKIIEMQPEPYVMHGEAVNIDGAFCAVLANRRGMLSDADLARVFAAMRAVGLPTENPHMYELDILDKACSDAVEHRHGAQRIPLLTGIGSSRCVSDITREELEGARVAFKAMHA